MKQRINLHLIQTATGLLALLAVTLNVQAQTSPTDKERLTQNLHDWSSDELKILRRMWIGSLPPLPTDPTNKFADNSDAATLGKKIFFDPQFSANGKISCASCHDPKLNFTDGKNVSDGMGGKTRRNSPSIVGVAHGAWFFWDGRTDSQWSQALGPLESGVEHGGNRSQYAHTVASNPDYRKMYESIFGPLPDLSDKVRFPEKAGPVSSHEARQAWQAMSTDDQKTVTRIFVNIGKAIAAYERKLMPGPARFDHYVEAALEKDLAKMQQIFNEKETKGLKLFIGSATCSICHMGPLLTNYDFKNVAVPKVKSIGKDQGRFDGAQIVMKSQFNCLGEYSDAVENDCKELKFIKFTVDSTLGAFKVPSLRNVELTAPYMHAGQFATLSEVLKHYQNPPLSRMGHSDLLKFKLTDEDLENLEAFLKTLTGPLNTEPEWLQPS